MMMKWVNKDVDLKVLTKRIMTFFVERDFAVAEEEAAGKFRVSAFSIKKSRPKIVVEVIGNSNDFTISFACLGLDNRQERLTRILGPFITMLGGGFFLLKDLKNLDVLKKLEADFWDFVEFAIESIKK